MTNDAIALVRPGAAAAGGENRTGAMAELCGMLAAADVIARREAAPANQTV